MLSLYFLSFFSGGLLQLTDHLVDKKGPRVRNFEYVSSFWAGLIIGYLISQDAVFSTVFLGVIAANLLMGKVDAKALWLMFVPLLVMLAFKGVAAPSLLLLALFAVAGMLDEFLHDRGEKKGKRTGKEKAGAIAGAVSFLSKNRLFTDLFALGVSLVSGNPSYFFAIATFDAGYLFSSRLYR